MKLLHFAAVLAALATTQALAAGGSMEGPAGRNLVEHQYTSPPVGYLQFCRGYASDCQDAGERSPARELTASAWRELVEVNDGINSAIAPITDAELFGVAEYWTYPANQGDCEDYVLLKRKTLIERGWPANSVLITVVRDQYGDGHAVLTVVTSAGDLVLDNQDAEIRFWSETPYRYLKRQSRTDATKWVSLQDDRQLNNSPVVATSR